MSLNPITFPANSAQRTQPREIRNNSAIFLVGPAPCPGRGGSAGSHGAYRRHAGAGRSQTISPRRRNRIEYDDNGRCPVVKGVNLKPEGIRFDPIH
ncbi:hypothetical protein EVAR_69034_1 [Eumeta japonica]|uniref:Uncharacterized protein n=1 Tax=Eumeta variegata TaxID=151549 RepID=A0A4C1SSB4_EUMVA|nr:hypothetical protein EVAR_69034_1 [Eumeta japonica]